MATKGYPCTINGVHYESESAASRSSGIHEATLRHRLRSPNFPGYTSEHHPKFRIKPLGRACTIDGVLYQSEYAATKALGIDASTLRLRLCSPDFPGYTSEHHPRVDVKPRGEACIIDGIEHVSAKKAAKALGISLGSLLSRLHSSNYPEYVSQYRPKEKRRRHLLPCSVAGVEYASLADASRRLGITEGMIRRRLASPDFPDYACAHIPKKPPEPLRYTVRGKSYRTLQEIANAEGVTRERVRQRMNDPSYPDYISADIPKGPPPSPKYMVNGKPYRKLREIAEAEGLTIYKVRQKLDNPSCLEYQQSYKRRT